jgi:protein TonB
MIALLSVPIAGRDAVRVGGEIRPPTRVKNVQPVYPDDAKAAGVSGIVLVEITIGTRGSVVDAQVSKSIPLLDQAALDAIYQWEYEPTVLNGEPVEVLMTVTVNFTLE